MQRGSVSFSCIYRFPLFSMMHTRPAATSSPRSSLFVFLGPAFTCRQREKKICIYTYIWVDCATLLGFHASSTPGIDHMLYENHVTKSCFTKHSGNKYHTKPKSHEYKITKPTLFRLLGENTLKTDKPPTRPLLNITNGLRRPRRDGLVRTFQRDIKREGKKDSLRYCNPRTRNLARPTDARQWRVNTASASPRDTHSVAIQRNSSLGNHEYMYMIMFNI